MEMIPVQSSNIAAVGYVEQTETLVIEFLNGSSYEYGNVPLVVYNDLMNASSVGSYFNREIKDNYPCNKIG
jgi:hypothetical protein